MKYTNIAVVVVAFLVVAACGGGGGDGAAPAGGNPSPGSGSGGSGGSGGNPVFNPRDPAGNVYSTHYQPEFNVSIPYPEMWSVLVGSGLVQPDVFVEIEEFSANPNHLFDVTIRISRVAIGAGTLPPRITAGQVLETNQVMVGPHAAVETVFDGDEMGISQELRFIETILDIDGSRYAILVTVERNNQYQEYGGVMRYIVQRFEVGINVIEVERLFRPGSAAIATNGTDFLAVACRPDSRSGFLDGTLVAQRLGSGAIRIGDELVLDDQRIPCLGATPTISWDGTNYLVSYIREMDFDIVVNGQVIDNDQLSVVGKRVSPAGAILDSDPILISTSGTFQETNNFRNKPASLPHSSFDGARHIVVWEKQANPDTNAIENIRQIHGAFVAPDGTVDQNFVINDELIGLYGTSSYFFWRGDIAVGTDRILVVVGPRSEPASLSAPSPVYAQMIDFSGNLMSAEPILIRVDPGDQNPRYAQAAFDGTNFLVAWIEGTQIQSSVSGGYYGIRARKISPDGSLINGDANTVGFEVLAQDSIPREYLDLYFSRGEYLVVWSAIRGAIDTGLWGTRFSADLSSVADPAPIAGLGSDVSGGLSDNEFPMLVETPDAGIAIWTYDHFIKAWPIPDDFPGTR